MANALTFRITVLAVVILGILSTIIAAAGNVWLKQHVGNIKRFMGLWKTCLKIEGLDSVCSTYKLISFRSSTKAKLDATKAFMIITVVLYGLASLLLVLVQVLKKKLFQKIIVPVLWFTMLCGIIAMSCFTNFSKELVGKDWCGSNCYSFGWTYGIGWVSVVLALVGAIIASIGVFRKSEGA